MSDRRGDWTVSIISHRHGATILPTLESLADEMGGRRYRVVLTINTPEDSAHLRRAPGAVRRRLTVVHNSHQRSFGENHNRALIGSCSRFLLALDPELQLGPNVLEETESTLDSPRWGLVAPRAYTLSGEMDDNARRLVTPRALFARYLTARGSLDYAEPTADSTVEVDWLAGLFMACRASTFNAVGGFDPRYRLYCEDVDLCLRVRKMGYGIALLPRVRIVHPAGRRTLRELRHFRWHSSSMLRLWTSPAYRHRTQR